MNTLRSIIFITWFFNVRFLIRSKSSIHFINYRHIWIYFQKKTITVQKHDVLNFFLNNSILKSFTNLQNVIQTTFYAIKNRKFYRFFSSHDFEKRESQFFTIFFNQLIDFDFFDLNARQFKHLIDYNNTRFNLDRFIDFVKFLKRQQFFEIINNVKKQVV